MSEAGLVGRRRFRGPADVLLAGRVGLWLLLSPLLLRYGDLQRVLACLDLRRASESSEDLQSRSRRIIRYADALMRWRLFGRKIVCWKRALVLFRLLPRGRQHVRILFGVELDGLGELQGHAWVELDGEALDGTDPGRYRVTVAQPPFGERIPVTGTHRSGAARMPV